MKWFYMIRGEANRHGVADEDTLADMARRGQIGSEDLVWNQENGTDWLRAGSVPGLLPEIVPVSAPLPSTAQAPVQPGAKQQSTPSRAQTSRWMWLVLVVLFLVVLAVAVLWLPPGLRRWTR